MMKTTFSEVIKEHFSELADYTPVLARVHGRNHPELAQVRDIFTEINAKVREEDLNELDLSTEFTQLREITNDYSVPSDGCGTYLATYEMLEEADRAYFQSI